MRTATEVGSVCHIFSHLFYRSWAGYCTLLNPSNANTGLRRQNFTFQQDSLPGQTVLSAIHVLVSMTGNFPFCVLLTVEILDFFEYVLVFFSFYATTYLVHIAIIQKILVIMPCYPCFPSCVLLHANSVFTYNEAALAIKLLRLLEKVLLCLQNIKDITL